MYCFNVETGKLDSEGKKLIVEKMWNVMDVTIMEVKSRPRIALAVFSEIKIELLWGEKCLAFYK